MFQDEVSASAQQDQWRSARMFIGGLNRAFNGDQTMAGADPYAVNAPGQFRTVGPYSTSIEGLPVTTTSNGGLVISPAVMLIGIGVAAAFLLRKG